MQHYKRTVSERECAYSGLVDQTNTDTARYTTRTRMNMHTSSLGVGTLASRYRRGTLYIKNARMTYV